MAVTIGRTAITDDSGGGTDGTGLDNAWKQELYTQIDTALALLLPLAGGTLTGILTLTGLPDASGGLILQAVTTGRPTIDFRNATTGLLAEIIGTAAKGLQLTSNAGANYAVSAYANGGVYLGGPSPTDPGANNTLVAGTLGSIAANSGGAALTVTELRLFANATTGASMAGFGSSYDFTLFNRSVSAVIRNPANTLNVEMTGTLKLTAMTATTWVSGDKYVVVDASGNFHRSAIGPAS